MSKPTGFKKDSYRTCGHPEGVHNPMCWSYGLVDPNCRKHCNKFVLDNLKYLEQRYEESRKKR
jgi:hypothetical protein